MNFTIKNPKKSNNNNDVLSSAFNYHAGFSNIFVQKILDNNQINKNAIILDPWNGMGTTTFVANNLGFQSIGIDLNPIMVLISLSNHASTDDINSAIKKVKHLRVDCLPNSSSLVTHEDLLSTWFDDDVVKYIRYIDTFISSKPLLKLDEKIKKITTRDAIIYASLFILVKKLLGSFIGSNPTWIKQKGIKEKLHVSNKDLKMQLCLLLQKQQEKIALLDHNVMLPHLIHASSADMPIDDSSVDIILTSPPYCTRIDYGIATLSELAVFLGYDITTINKIRRMLTGRTTIDKKIHPILNKLNIGKKGKLFLHEVRTHDSYASKNYYFKNLYQYFYDIEKSFKEIARVIKQKGLFFCVVQDSFYKDIHCDLPNIILEIAKIYGFVEINKYDFEVTANLVNLNKNSIKYRKKTNAYESVLILQKV